jgi:regulator of replication initiation timing
MAKIDTKELFDRAEKLKEERAENYRQATAVRETLRNLRDSSMLTEAEESKLEEIFPTRTRSSSEDAEPDGE